MTVPESLAEVLERVHQDTALPGRRRQDMAWALRRLGKVLHLPLGDITANPAALSNRLRNVTPAAAGMSAGSWSNLQSLVRQALRHTGCYVHPGRHQVPLTPAWAALYAKPSDDNLRYGLSRFVHFASARDWQPDEISEGHFETFHHELVHHSICRAPERTHRNARLRWNQAVREIPGWPQRPVPVPRREEGYCFAWDRFSATLESEVDAYLAFRTQGTLLDDSDIKRLSASSAESQKFCLRQLASALVYRGVSPDSLAHLPDLVRPQHLKEGLHFFLARSGETPTAQMTNIANAALGAARYLARPESGQLTEAEVAQVHQLYKKVEHRPSGMNDKNRERLRVFGDPGNVAKALFLPRRLVNDVTPEQPNATDALKVRSALAIELWLLFPLRRHNMAKLHLERHFRWTGTTENQRVFLVIPAHEVKNNQDLEVELPAEARKLLALYLKRYRPLLVDTPNSWLFPAQKGDGHQHVTGFGEHITRVIRRRTGLDINPHLFRHLAAKLYLDANPGQFEVVRRLLGHKTIDTTVRFYAEMDSLMATRLFDDHILRLREQLAASPDKATTKKEAA